MNQYKKHYSISKTKVQKLKPVDLAFIRSLGPYIDVDPDRKKMASDLKRLKTALERTNG